LRVLIGVAAMLSPDVQARILALHFGQGKRVRAIARELGINRKSVAAVVARRLIRTAPADALAPRRSMLDPYKPMIQEKLLRDPAMPASAIHQSLRKLGFVGSVRRLQEYVATVRVDPKPREAFLKLMFEPGETAQVDWGEFGDVFGDGCKIHAFVMVLCYSRKLYVEFTRSEKFEDFIRAHERASPRSAGTITWRPPLRSGWASSSALTRDFGPTSAITA